MAPTATAVPPKTRMNVPTSSASAAGRMGSLVLLPYSPSPLSSSSLSTTPSLAARRMSSLVMRCPAAPSATPSAMPGPAVPLLASPGPRRRMLGAGSSCMRRSSPPVGPEAGMSGPRLRARGRSSSWSPPARCTSTASGSSPCDRPLPGSTDLPSSSVLPLPISLLPPFREPAVPLIDDLLVLGAPLLGTLLVATVLLARLGAHRLLGGFHRLADGLPGEHPHDRIHDDVAHAAHPPSPPTPGVPDLGGLAGHL